MHIYTATTAEYQQYKTELIGLYFEAFATGDSAQYLNLFDTEAYIKSAFDCGYGIFAVDGNCLVGMTLCTPLHYARELPESIAQEFPVAKCLYIAEMAVAENQRGKRIGQAMMQYLLANADTHYSHVFLRVWTQNEAAIAVYQKFGFVGFCEVIQFKELPDSRIPFVMDKLYMYRSIASS